MENILAELQANRKILKVKSISKSAVNLADSENERCRFKYNCEEGIVCLYQHSEAELDYFEENGGRGNPARKTNECKHFKQGYCYRRKEDCDFAHGDDDAWCTNCKVNGHYKEDCYR